MIIISFDDANVAFKTAYSPAPFDVFFTRGPWLSWLRARVVTLEVA